MITNLLSTITIPIKKSSTSEEIYTAEEWIERIVVEHLITKGNYWINCADISLLIGARLKCSIIRFEGHSVAHFNGWFIDPQCNCYLKAKHFPITSENIHLATVNVLNESYPIKYNLIYDFYTSKPLIIDKTYLQLT